jgi:hypothetical protein
MAFTTPGTAVAGEVLTAAFWNEQVRDNTVYLKTEADAVGLVFITEATGSTISVNDCFTTDFRHYKIFFSTTATAVTGGLIRMRLRAAGSDDSANNYITQRASFDATVSTISRQTNTYFEPVGEVTNQAGSNSTIEMTVFDPATTRSTGLSLQAQAALNRNFSCSGIFDLGTVFDGFSLFPAAGTMSGLVRVYGIR